MFLQAPAVKIPESLKVPDALVTWKSIYTLGTDRNLVPSYVAKAALPISDTSTLKAAEGISNAGGRRDVRKSYTRQLTMQRDALYYAVNTHFGICVVRS